MNDDKLYVIITNKPSGEVDASTGSSEETSKSKSKSSGVQSYAVHQFYNLITSQVKADINYSISNIGNFTGDYQKQADVNASVGLAMSAAGIGMSAVAGFKIAGIPGAIIGAVVSGAAFGINLYRQDKIANFENKKLNTEIETLRQRSGNDVLNNGSRTGN